MDVWLVSILLLLVILMVFYREKKEEYCADLSYNPGFAGNLYPNLPVMRVYEHSDYKGRYVDLTPGWWNLNTLSSVGSLRFINKRIMHVTYNREYKVRATIYKDAMQYLDADGFKCCGENVMMFDDIPDLSKVGLVNPGCIYIFLEPYFHAQWGPHYKTLCAINAWMRHQPYA